MYPPTYTLGRNRMLQSLPHIVISFIINEKTALHRAIVSLASRESLRTVRLNCPPFNPTHPELAWNAWLRHHFPPCNVWVVNIHEGIYQWRLQRHMEATASILDKFAPKCLSLFTHNFLMFWQFLTDLPHEWTPHDTFAIGSDIPTSQRLASPVARGHLISFLHRIHVESEKKRWQ